MSNEQKTPEQLREELIDALKRHDWHYGYSDDYRYWRAGADQRQRIRQLVALVPDGQGLYDQHRPADAS